MKKIKVIRIIARLNIGGPAIHAVLLTAGLNKDQFESILVSGSIGSHEGDMLYYADEKGVKPYFIPALQRNINLFGDLIALKQIYAVICRERPNIIHTHTAKAGTLGRLAGILYNFFYSINRDRVYLIHTLHGHVFNGYFNKPKTRLFIIIERFLALFTDRIITVSKSVKDDLLSLSIAKEYKINVIPLGFELNKFLNISPKDSQSFNVGIIGRLVPIKNHFLFLDSAVKLLQANPDIKLRIKIIGDGELRRELEEYSYKIGIAEQVDFLGWQKDLIKVYSDLDVVALSSINEGTPVSLIEAMAAGKAIVATDVGGVRDLLGKEVNTATNPQNNFKVLERGIIVAPQDSNGFASALNFILRNNELRKKMGSLGREFAKDGFSVIRLTKDIENLYRDVINPPS